MNSDMSLMITFCSTVLQHVCTFLMTPPVFYLFALFCFLLVCKALKIIMR